MKKVRSQYKSGATSGAKSGATSGTTSDTTSGTTTPAPQSKREAAVGNAVFAKEHKKLKDSLGKMYQTCKSLDANFTEGQQCQTYKGGDEFSDSYHALCYWDHYLEAKRIKGTDEIKGECGVIVGPGTFTTVKGSPNPSAGFWDKTECIDDDCDFTYGKKGLIFFFKMPCD